MPSTRVPAPVDLGKYGWKRHFSAETIAPGYYGCDLDGGMHVNVTAAQYTAVHKYTWARGSAPVLVVDAGHALEPGSCKHAEVQVDVLNNSASGSQYNDKGMSGRIGGLRVFFVMKWVQPDLRSNCTVDMAGTVVWSNSTLSPGTSAAGASAGAGVLFQCDPGATPALDVYVAISFISIEQAWDNLRADTNSLALSFADIVAETRGKWTQALAPVQAAPSAHLDDMTRLYTGLYHALMAPTLFSEVGGNYVGFDGKVHGSDAKSGLRYSDMSIWDIHRTQVPLMSVVAPRVLRDCVRSLLNMALEGGGPTELALECMVNASVLPHTKCGRDVEDWLQLGYIPYEKSTHGACETLAYSYDDFSVGRFAEALGNHTVAGPFKARGQNYRHVWDPSVKQMCPKTTAGKWDCPPTFLDVFDKRYVEGDAMHYRWFVPHDVPGLISLFGSNATFCHELSTFMFRSRDDPSNLLPNPYYWPGNEPDIMSGFLFNFAGCAEYTQEYTRWFAEHKFTLGPEGIPGNDDYGTMSSWLVWTLWGLYPLAGSDTLFIASPAFPSVNITNPSTGSTVRIIAHGASRTSVFVQRLEVNGKAHTFPFLRHDECFGIPQECTLEFWMSDKRSTWFA
eukprot:gene12221-2230_t